MDMNIGRGKLRYLLALLAGLMIVNAVSAQEEARILTLDECINIALENNIGIKRAQNDAIAARANKIQAMANYLPDLNAGLGYDFFQGNTFDQTAARLVTTTTSQLSPRLTSNVVLFNGLSNTYGLQRRASEFEAAEESIQASRLQVRADVLGAFLNVILDRENIKISDQRIALLQAQLEREEKRVSVGVSNPETVYNFRSQLASERLVRVQAENTYKSDMLGLVQLLQLDATQPYEIETIDLSNDEVLLEADPYEDVLAASLTYSPLLKRSNLTFRASSYQMKQVRSSRYPRITAVGQLGSNYSSNGAYNPETQQPDANATFNEQLRWNEYRYLGFNLGIPIFTRLQTNANVQAAKVAMYNSELDVTEARQTITNTIQRVYLDLSAAQSTFRSAQENMDALTQSYNFSETRYNSGNTDFYTYLESLNNKNRAEIQLVNAKYSIIFRKKILDIYRGMASEN